MYTSVPLDVRVRAVEWPATFADGWKNRFELSWLRNQYFQVNTGRQAGHSDQVFCQKKYPAHVWGYVRKSDHLQHFE
jgi:hypothetical protein